MSRNGRKRAEAVDDFGHNAAKADGARRRRVKDFVAANNLSSTEAVSLTDVIRLLCEFGASEVDAARRARERNEQKGQTRKGEDPLEMSDDDIATTNDVVNSIQQIGQLYNEVINLKGLAPIEAALFNKWCEQLIVLLFALREGSNHPFFVTWQLNRNKLFRGHTALLNERQAQFRILVFVRAMKVLFGVAVDRACDRAGRIGKETKTIDKVTRDHLRRWKLGVQKAGSTPGAFDAQMAISVAQLEKSVTDEKQLCAWLRKELVETLRPPKAWIEAEGQNALLPYYGAAPETSA